MNASASMVSRKSIVLYTLCFTLKTCKILYAVYSNLENGP